MKHFFSVAASVALASAAHASFLQFEFDVTVDSNELTTGAFAGVLPSQTLTVVYSVDTSFAPTSTFPGFNRWDQFFLTPPDTLISEISVTGPGLDYTLGSTGFSNSTVFVADDFSDSDQFGISVELDASNVDAATIGLVLFGTGSGVVDTSLTGLGIPTTEEELDLATFDAAFFGIDSPDFSESLLGTVTAVRIIPAPSALALFAGAGLAAARRLRA